MPKIESPNRAADLCGRQVPESNGYKRDNGNALHAETEVEPADQLQRYNRAAEQERNSRLHCSTLPAKGFLKRDDQGAEAV